MLHLLSIFLDPTYTDLNIRKAVSGALQILPELQSQLQSRRIAQVQRMLYKQKVNFSGSANRKRVFYLQSKFYPTSHIKYFKVYEQKGLVLLALENKT